MDFIPKEIQNYAESHTDPETELLYQLNRETHIKVMYPRMLSGHLQGRILSMLSKLVRPKNILEVGTYTGYAAHCLIEGMQEGGKLYTIEIDPETADFALRFFKMANIDHKIVLMVGDAVELIPQINETIDLVFLDAEKEQYLTYFEAVLPKMPSGGLIIADNVIWSGNVINSEINDNTTKAIRKFNDAIFADERVEKVMLPVRDGLYLIRKK